MNHHRLSYFTTIVDDLVIVYFLLSEKSCAMPWNLNYDGCSLYRFNRSLFTMKCTSYKYFLVYFYWTQMKTRNSSNSGEQVKYDPHIIQIDEMICDSLVFCSLAIYYGP